MRQRIVALTAAFVVALTACTSGETTLPTSTTWPVESRGPTGERAFLAASLQPFESCNEFLDHVKSYALERVGPYGLVGYGGGYYGIPELSTDMVLAEETSTARFDSAPQTAAAPVEGVDFSGTNVQVAGIDEPDIVKTDGERIFVVSENTLYWIDASGVPEIAASLPLEGWGHQLFLSGDTLLVMASGGGYTYGNDVVVESEFYYHSESFTLVEIDVSDPSSMNAVATLTLDGALLSSRMTGGTIRVVTRSQPVGFDWFYPEGNGIRAEQKSYEANRELIEESTLENWVPWYVLRDHQSSTTSDGPFLGCDQVGHPEEYSGLSMLTVLSIDLDSGLDLGNGIGLLAEGQTIYASNENLYIATSPWMAWAAADYQQGGDVELKSQIHVFDISDPETALYVASGEVTGTLLSQWSMDEYEGVLRVVVTDESPWLWSSEDSNTSVVTLQRSGDELLQIGSVDGLGLGERVYAVRFIEEKGYVVTFRQVDPLYVIDLSDPESPSVTGELKINGYSAYLHPIGEDLLLGVGQDATDEGRATGTQVSVFDVSDPTDPRRLSRLTFEDAYSEAEWDHHAFLWWSPSEIAVLPLQRWSWDSETGNEDYYSGAVVLTATPQRVEKIGDIQHPYKDGEDCEECMIWTPSIMRSLVIGETLFTFSEAGVLASDLETLGEISWISYN